MRWIPAPFAGLIAFLALFALLAFLSLGCSSNETPAKGEQEQIQSASTESRQQVSQSDREREQEPQPDQPEQPKRAAAAEERQSRQASAQDSPPEAAPDRQDQSQQSQQAAAPAEQEQKMQQEQPAEPASKVFIGGVRPAALLLPQGADRMEPRPLIVLLHGYGSHAQQADQYFRFSSWVDKAGFGLLLPEGARDRNGVQFWNGTDECCNMFGAETDDVAYLKSLVEEARGYAQFDQIFAVGHSNGGFMAYRLACEQVSGLSGIVSLAGGAHSSADECRVPEPLSVLQIHGTEDDLVLYETGRLPTHPDPDRAPVPGAWASVTRWAERAGCDLDAVRELPRIDTDSSVEGLETTIKRYAKGCIDSTVMELWTIEGGGHVPIVWETDFTPQILKWILDRYQQAIQGAEPSAAEVKELSVGGERTARLLVPGNTTDQKIPLVVSLHGYRSQAEAHDQYFGLSVRVSEYGFALITPQGTADERGNHFWNATDACCNFDGSTIDDYRWLSSLVAEAREMVDISGVYVVGHSNGGFMSYRLACDGLDGLVAIASLAGSSFGESERCADAAPVSVLQIHGTDDVDIPYVGTLEFAGGYPGASEVIQRWAEVAGCEVESVEELPNIDLEATIDGAETTVGRIREGCVDGITVELWTIAGGDHFPQFQNDWPDRLLNWLLNESRTN